MVNLETIKLGWACKCPKCREGKIFKPGLLSLNLEEKCPRCGLDLDKNDSADGPAVFLIFILGFALVPIALWLDFAFGMPLWVHALLWTAVALGIVLGTLKPLKAYIIALQYKYRPNDWE